MDGSGHNGDAIISYSRAIELDGEATDGWINLALARKAAGKTVYGDLWHHWPPRPSGLLGLPASWPCMPSGLLAFRPLSVPAS